MNGNGGTTNPERRVKGFIAGLACFAAAAAAAGAWLGAPTKVSLWEAVSLTLLLACAEFLIVRFRLGGEVDGVNLFEAAMAPVIFALPGAFAVGAVVVSQALVNAVRRNSLLKGTFNVAQWAGAAGAGSLVFLGLRTGATLSPRNVAALAIALFTISLFNYLAFANAMRIMRGTSIREVVAGLAPVFFPRWPFGWPLIGALGLLFVGALQWSRAAIPLFFVPLLALHWAYNQYAAANADRARLEALHRAGQVLTGPVDARDAIPTFLEEIRSSFQTEAAELIVIGEGEQTRYRLSDGFTVTTDVSLSNTLAKALIAGNGAVRVTADDPNVMLASLLRVEGWRDVLAAPLLADGAVTGLLCAYNRHGAEAFEESELHVLQALARETAAALSKSSLVQAVVAERRKLADIVEHTSDGIFTLGADGVVLTWNPGLEEISGYAASEMTGGRTIAYLHPRDADDREVGFEAWAQTGIELPTALQIVGRNGHTHWLSCSYTRVTDADGNAAVLIVVARDVTAAHEVERLKDDFVATVSHELRTPLTPIKAWATTLLSVGDAIDPAQRQEGLRAMLRQADRLESLITNLLQVSKVERGVSERHDVVIDTNAAAAKVVEEFRSAHPAREIRLEIAKTWSKAHGDELWVEQIITNLLSNAVKYAPPDQPIDVRVIAGSSDVAIAVTDRGPGIPAHESERIFERFHRLGDHMTRAQGGAGLGLYIARQLASSIGSTLTVESTPGEGTTFTLRLRAADRLVIVA